MRTGKSSDRFAKKLDRIFWFIVLIMPYFSYIFSFFSKSSELPTNFPGFLRYYFLGDSTFINNVVWNALYHLFGPSGTFPVFSSPSGLYIFYWFVWVEIFHVFFDVIVFIPRIAHKFISKAVQDD